MTQQETRNKKISEKKNLEKENGLNIAYYIAKTPIHRLCNSVIDSEKENGFNIAHYIAKAPIHRLCNRVIDSSVLISFHLSQNVYQAKK